MRTSCPICESRMKARIKKKEQEQKETYRLANLHLEWKIKGYTYTEIQEQNKEQGKRAHLAPASF